MASNQDEQSKEQTPPVDDITAQDALPKNSNEADAEAAQTPAETVTAEETEPDLESPETRIAGLEQQLLRLQADFENFRKRTRREKEEWTQRSIERVVEDLLSVLDNFELGLSNAEQNDLQEGVLQGFRMVQEQMNTILGKYGLKPVDALGEAFDPNLHEAVTHMPSADTPEDHVFAQTRRGYFLGEKLLRPTQVVVSSGAPDSIGDVDEEEND